MPQIKVSTKVPLQQFLFRNPERGYRVVITIENILDDGTPVDPETGDDLEYVGVVVSPNVPTGEVEEE